MSPRWLALVAAVVYVALVASQLNRPLIYDDANFALAAKAVADSGQPLGNQGWMSERGDFSQENQWALWHPPLYVYVLGVFSKLGGWSPIVLRLPGLLGGLATALLAFVLARDITRGPPSARELAASSAAALVLLTPMAVQSALIVDIDAALLLPLTLLFLWLYLRGAPLWQLTLLFAALLWTKMTNPLPLLAVVVVWQVLRWQPRTAALHLLGIGAGGAAIFGLTYAVFGTISGWPLDMPFGVNMVQWQDSSDVARRAYASPGAFVEGLQPTVLWIGPGLVTLGLAGVAIRCAALARCWKFVRADVLVGLALLLVLGYVNKNAGWFPKYQVALVPLFAVLGGGLVAHVWCKQPRLAVIVTTALAVVSLVVTSRLARDDWALQRTFAIDGAAAGWLLGGFAVAVLLASRWRSLSVAALAGIAVGWSVGTDVVQLTAPYSTTYQYGTTGVREAVAWLDANVQPGETYVGAKELAIRATNQRYVDQDTLLYFLDTGRGFDGTWAGQPVRSVVAWQREPYVAQLLSERLTGYVEVGRFGDYVAYQRPQ